MHFTDPCFDIFFKNTSKVIQNICIRIWFIYKLGRGFILIIKYIISLQRNHGIFGIIKNRFKTQLIFEIGHFFYIK